MTIFSVCMLNNSIKGILLKIYNLLFPIASPRRFWLYDNFMYRLFPDEIDKVLQQYFKTKDEIAFMVIGANDGVERDKVYKYARRYCCKGILIEPLPEIFEILKSNYSKIRNGNFYFENCLVCESPGSRYLYVFEGDDIVKSKLHRISSLKRSHLERPTWLNGDYRIGKKLVNGTTVNALLEKYNLFHLNLLVIDAEGYDFEIIKTIDFARFTLDLIIYEHINLSNEDKAASIAYISQRGYSIVSDSIDAIAVRSTEV